MILSFVPSFSIPLFFKNLLLSPPAKIGSLICLSAIFGPLIITQKDPSMMKDATKVTELLIEGIEELFGYFKFDGDVRFEDVYEVRGVLGKGAFAVAKEITHRQTGLSYAVKMISKGKLTPGNN